MVKIANPYASLAAVAGALAAVLSACGDSKESAQKELLQSGALSSVLDPAGEEGKRAMRQAIQRENADMVRRLLLAGADVNAILPNGCTPLLYALAGNRVSMAKLLLEHGADISITTKEGESALMLSALMGNLELVEKLLDMGAEVDAEDDGGWTALMAACMKSDRVSNRHASVSNVFAYSHLKHRKVHTATPAVRRALVARLIRAGADVNHEARDGWTPIAVAACEGREFIVKQLLQAGAKCNQKAGISPLMTAAISGETGTIKILLESHSRVNAVSHTGKTALLYAARSGNAEAVKLLLDAGADANYTAPGNGESAVSEAAHGGHEALVDMLLKRGASVSGDGLALRYAVRGGHVEMIEKLIHAGADVNKLTRVRGHSPSMPLSEAVKLLLSNKGMRENPEPAIRIIEMLAQAGAVPLDPMHSTELMHRSEAEKILTSLHFDLATKEKALKALVSRKEHTHEMMGDHIVANLLNITEPNTRHELIHLALQYGASPNELDKSGDPVIFDALRFQCQKEVQELLEHGVDISLRNHLGETLLEMAVKDKNTPVVKQLLERGADPNSISPEGEPMLQLAIRSGSKLTVQELLAKGADPNLPAQDGCTMLQLILSASNIEKKDKLAMLQTMVAAGADPRARVKPGSEPLLFLAVHNAEEVDLIRLLLEAGVEVNATYGSRTALDQATAPEVVELLRAHGGKRQEELSH